MQTQLNELASDKLKISNYLDKISRKILKLVFYKIRTKLYKISTAEFTDAESRGAQPGGLPSYGPAWRPFCAVTQGETRTFCTAPASAVSTYLGPPKPHDARSVSPDAALRTPPH